MIKTKNSQKAPKEQCFAFLAWRFLYTAIAKHERRVFVFLGALFKKPIKASTELVLAGSFNIRKHGRKKWMVYLLKLLRLVVLAAFLVVSIPFWLIGEVFEILGSFAKRLYEHDETFEDMDLDDISLDPDKTKYLNFPLSTYQYSANRKFCSNSDWGVYCKKHFKEEKGTDHLGPWHGVDILTDEGFKLICEKTIKAGANSLRFSVEWPDIEKKEGKYDLKAMKAYVKVAKALRAQNIEPLVVLHHFVTPLDEKGRNIFESPKSIDRFVNFASFVYEHMKDDVSVFFTFNEPNVQAIGNYVLGMFPMQQIAQFSLCRKVLKNMLKAHKKVYQKLHELSSEKPVKVGITHSATCFVSSSRWNLITRIVKFSMTHLFHDVFMDWVGKNARFVDLLGVQFYSRPYIGGILPKSTCRKGEIMLNEMEYRFDPHGILPVLRDINFRLKGKVDLFVSETGLPGRNSLHESSDMDDLRELYFKVVALGIRKAQDEKIPVIGLAPWTIFSNFEWDKGYAVDFGNIARDPKSHKMRETKGYHAIRSVFHNTLAKKKFEYKVKKKRSKFGRFLRLLKGKKP